MAVLTALTEALQCGVHLTAAVGVLRAMLIDASVAKCWLDDTAVVEGTKFPGSALSAEGHTGDVSVAHG